MEEVFGAFAIALIAIAILSFVVKLGGYLVVDLNNATIQEISERQTESGNTCKYYLKDSSVSFNGVCGLYKVGDRVK